jgi:hypothetical protein
MSAELIAFYSTEDSALDTTRIITLRQSLGDQRCREIVEEVVYHLSDRLAQLETALEAADMSAMEGLVARLAGLSEQVGLANFARVARDLRGCIEVGDRTATFAVASRLIRLGEDSLCSVMLYADQSAL